MTTAFAIFGISLVGLLGVFGLKAWEVSRGSVTAPRLRERLDGYALTLKRLVAQAGHLIEQLPSLAVWTLRTVVHVLAVATAAVARVAERRAHQIADLVSHKHSHEHAQQKRTESHFLSQISEETNMKERDERGVEQHRQDG